MCPFKSSIGQQKLGRGPPRIVYSFFFFFFFPIGSMLVLYHLYFHSETIHRLEKYIYINESLNRFVLLRVCRWCA